MCEVILRRIFNRPQIWTQDLIVMLFACYIILISAYGLQKKASWRWTWSTLCSLSGPAHPAYRHIRDLPGPLPDGSRSRQLDLLPDAYTTGEQTYSVWAAPTWPVKLCLFVGLVLLAIQAVSEILKHVEGLVTLPRTERRRRDDCDFGTTAGAGRSR